MHAARVIFARTVQVNSLERMLQSSVINEKPARRSPRAHQDGEEATET